MLLLRKVVLRVLLEDKEGYFFVVLGNAVF